MSLFSTFFTSFTGIFMSAPGSSDSHPAEVTWMHFPQLDITPEEPAVSEKEFSWHNAWGTTADFQIPAESENLFKSNDWSTDCSGSGM
jgi:hypothetical protein